MRWAEENRVNTTDDLTRGRSDRVSGMAASRSHVAPATFNKWIRAVENGCWRYSIDADLCPKLDHADLKRIKQEQMPPPSLRGFLTPAKVRKLLEACERHDAATYSTDAPGKDRRASEAGTPRYQPISGFALFVLLTGCRLNEAVGLDWKDVDLDALGHSGKATGQFQIRAAHFENQEAAHRQPSRQPCAAAAHGGSKATDGRTREGVGRDRGRGQRSPETPSEGLRSPGCFQLASATPDLQHFPSQQRRHFRKRERLHGSQNN